LEAAQADLAQRRAALDQAQVAAFVLLLTPTGSPPSPRWRWWAWGLAGVTAVLLVAATIAPGSLDPNALVAGGPQEFRAFGGALRVANVAAQVVAILTILARTASLVVRFRLARQVERQQLRWLALAAALTGVAMPSSSSGWASSWAGSPPWWWRLPPWPWPRCSSRPAAESRLRWTGGLTAAATTQPGSSRPSGLACATRST
jgi:hypothetical protein